MFAQGRHLNYKCRLIPLKQKEKKKNHELQNEWEHQEQLIPVPRVPNPASGTAEGSIMTKEAPFSRPR